MIEKKLGRTDFEPEVLFPNLIWKARLEEANFESIKSFAYNLKDLNEGRTLSNQGGWQSNDIKKGECPAIDAVVEEIDTAIAELSGQVGIPHTECLSLWININPPGSYNLEHHHSDAMFSGVFYIDAEKNQGDIVFSRSDGGEHFLPDLTNYYKTNYNQLNRHFPPLTGNLYIFPGWLRHSVLANNTDKDRVGISFNWGMPTILKSNYSN